MLRIARGKAHALDGGRLHPFSSGAHNTPRTYISFRRERPRSGGTRASGTGNDPRGSLGSLEPASTLLTNGELERQGLRRKADLWTVTAAVFAGFQRVHSHLGERQALQKERPQRRGEAYAFCPRQASRRGPRAKRRALHPIMCLIGSSRRMICASAPPSPWRSSKDRSGSAS